MAQLACQRPGSDRAATALAADRARSEAMIAADAERLHALLHDDLTYTHSNGQVDTKASLLRALASGRVDYRAIEPRDLRVRVHGPTAVVTGSVGIVVATPRRQLDLASVYTAVYWWQDGRWQLAAYQSSPAGSR